MNEHSNETDSEPEIAAVAPTPVVADRDVTPHDDDTAALNMAPTEGTSRVRTNDYVPTQVVDDGAATLFSLGLGAFFILAAVAAMFFLYSSDDTEASSLVARRAEATVVPTVAAASTPVATASVVAPTATPLPAVPEPEPEPEPVTVFDRTLASDQFSSLSSALGAVGLGDDLATLSPITVFAPIDSAFANVDLSGLSDREIGEILAYHVVDGTYTSADLRVGDSLVAITGEPIVIDDGFILNGQAAIIDTDIEASNGVIHAIDSVLVPRAFGPSVRDLLASDRTDLTSLAVAVEALGLGDALEQPGPITVFAPVNAAFEDPAPVLAAADDEQVAAVLAYHVVPGQYLSSDLSVGQELTTLQGETLVITEGLRVNDDAEITGADLLARNGVVHKVDRVLVPGTLQTEQALNDLFALDPIQFATASARILPVSVPVLDQAIETLTANPTGAVEIEGHTDTVGGESPNQELSQRRAESVLAYLVDGGVEADRLTAIGYGESRLKIDPEESASDRQQNRRIEFRVG